ncbi:hypothetical protein B484DRAFT_438033, partial [Ochromonadaceae sp. CCMP2298]
VFYVALVWFDLLNLFQFEPPIYLIFFTIAGILTVMFGCLVWGLNRLLTKLRHPPSFHGSTLLYTLAHPSLFGVALSCGPIMIAIVMFWTWFMSAEDGGTICSADPENAPSPMCFQDVLDWTAEADYDVLRSGRQQMCIFALGFYCCCIFAILVMPEYSEDDRKTDVERAAIKNKATMSKSALAAQQAKEQAEEDEDAIAPSDAFQPVKWRRATFLFLSIFVQLCLMVQMEFSYSPEVFVFSVACPDNLHFAPMVSAVSCISGMTTMGAPTFTAFIISYFADLFMVFVERLYISPFISEMMNLWPRWAMMLRRRF